MTTITAPAPALARRRDHPSLRTTTVTELARMRRGFLLWYALLAPVAITVPLYLGSMFSPEGASGETWRTFSNVTLEFWGVLVPLSAALTAALNVRADQDALRLLLSYGVPRWRYFVAKVAALAVLSLLSSTVLLALLAIGAGINGELAGQLGTVLAASYAPWVAGLGATALALLVAMPWGVGPAVAVGVAGMLSGALVADKSFWFVVPFAWPMRVILPIGDIGPNGIALPAGSPLAEASVIPLALALSVLLTVAVLFVGGRYMTVREV